MDSRSRRHALLEALVLALIAVAPLLPTLVKEMTVGVPRFATAGDYAGLEAAIRFVPSGRTMLGPYSRFVWNHPGPAWYVLAWPFYLLAGRGPTGLFFAATMLDALAASAIVVGVRVFTNRIGGTIAAIAVALFLTSFSAVMAWPWNPVTVVLPLAAFLVFASLLATGRARAAPFAALFGAVVAEHHIATVPTVVVVSVIAIALHLRRGRAEPRRWLWVALGVVVIAWMPPVLEELKESPGNLTKIAGFLLRPDKRDAVTSWSDAFHHWAFVSTWFPDRLFLTDPTYLTQVLPVRSEPLPLVVSRYTWNVIGVTVVAFVSAAALTWRRRDANAGTFLVMSFAANVMVVLSIHSVVGQVMFYLVFWAAAVNLVTWIAIATSFANAIADRRTSTVLFVAAGLVGGVALAEQSALVKRSDWLLPIVDPSVEETYRALRKRIDPDHLTPIIHTGEWGESLSLLLELDRDGIRPRVPRSDRWILGRQWDPPDDAPRPIHVWTHDIWLQEPAAKAHLQCAEKISTTVRFELWVSNTSCDVAP